MQSLMDGMSLDTDPLPVVPPYQVIIGALRRCMSKSAAPANLAIPQQLFDFLLSRTLFCVTFDEASYLSANPDVRQSIERGDVRSAQEHFCRYGYFEHRVGGTPNVDEAWYLAANPDVADAIKAGEVDSAFDHYTRWGAAEWRAPNRESVALVEFWKSLLVGHGDLIGQP
jgi:hypothetical protein